MTPEKLAPAVKPHNGGTAVSCHVQPNASRTAPAGMYGTALKLTLKTPPVDGKANKELCRFFADLFDLPGSSVQLLSGQTSRQKRVFVPVAPDVFVRKFCS